MLGFGSWDIPILGKYLEEREGALPQSGLLRAQHLRASLQSPHRLQQWMLTSTALHKLHHQVPTAKAQGRATILSSPYCIVPGILNIQHFCENKQQPTNWQ